jgi:hypothetical protein
MFQKLSDQLVSTSVKGLCMVYQLLIPEHEAFQRLRSQKGRGNTEQ